MHCKVWVFLDLHNFIQDKREQELLGRIEVLELSERLLLTQVADCTALIQWQ